MTRAKDKAQAEQVDRLTAKYYGKTTEEPFPVENIQIGGAPMKNVPALDDLFHDMNRELEQEGEGIRHFKRLLFGHSVEYLLFYDEGKLRGIAQYFPEDVLFADLEYVRPGQEYKLAEKAGNLNIAVHPAHRRKGFGTRLLRKAQEQWSVNLNDQSYTQEGEALVKAMQQ